MQLKAISGYWEPGISGKLMVLAFPYFAVSHLIYQANVNIAA